MRPVNLDVTRRAVGVLRVLIVLGTSRLNSPDVMCHAVTRQAELVDRAESQEPRIGRTMWRVTCHTTFGFYRGVLISEWPLFVRVTFNASSISAGGQSRLFKFETAMRVVTIAATHRAFHNFVMKGHGKGRFHFAVTTQTELRVAFFQQFDCRKARLFCVSCCDPCN